MIKKIIAYSLILSLSVNSALADFQVIVPAEHTSSSSPYTHHINKSPTKATAKEPKSNPFRHLFQSNDLWKELQNAMVLPHEIYREEVQSQIQFYIKHPKYLYDLAENAKPYMYYILQQVKKRKLPAEIALMPMIESAYDPFGVSSAGAVGLWQMMPGTASGFGLDINWWYDGRRDVVASTNAALNYLAYLENFFNGNWILALSAYDSGEGTVLRAVNRNTAAGKPSDFWSLPLPRETKAYVPKLLAIAEIISHPNKYPMELPAIKNEPYMAEVEVGSQIDLQKAAQLSGISLEELIRLNPGYKRWATSPKGHQKLIVPIEQVDYFKSNLAQLPKADRVTWQRYTIIRGDTLSVIANKFHTSVDLIKNINKLDSDIINIDEVLFIPLSTKQLPPEIVKSARQFAPMGNDKLPGPQKTIHKVAQGDSLWSIAKHYGVKESAIRFWNNLKPKAVLQPGQTVNLWLKQKKQSKSHATSKVKIEFYTVHSGDSLSVIARKYHSDVDVIRIASDLTSDTLMPGQIITIYKNLYLSHLPSNSLLYYEIKSGDTLDKIAYRNNTNSHTIKQLNGLDSTLLHAGQKLLVVKNALPSIHRSKATKSSQKMLYLTQKGDSLNSIAKKYKVSMDMVKKWNPKSGQNKLKTNQVLIIYQ